MSPRCAEVPVLGPEGFYRLAYAEWGPGAAPQVVVCAHGVSRNSHDFDFLAAALAAKGLRVVAPDRPNQPFDERMRDRSVRNRLDSLDGEDAQVGEPAVEAESWVGSVLTCFGRCAPAMA